MFRDGSYDLDNARLKVHLRGFSFFYESPRSLEAQILMKMSQGGNGLAGPLGDVFLPKQMETEMENFGQDFDHFANSPDFSDAPNNIPTALTKVAQAQGSEIAPFLVERLTSGILNQRLLASHFLDKLGFAAVPALKETSLSPDLEVRRRAIAMLQRIEKRQPEGLRIGDKTKLRLSPIWDRNKH
jgi:hypothetical protein